MHLYLSLIPQALIASMLPPEEFGRYYAVGTRVTTHDECMFFEVDPAFRSDEFPFPVAEERCVPHADGLPKRSVYLAIYRVLSRIPVSALGRLYLTTRDGQTLGLDRGEYQAGPTSALHLYQEFCPVQPLVASRLAPLEFCRFITDPDEPLHVPRIVFSELELRGLATDPQGGRADDLPYRRIEHLREVLTELASDRSKPSKLVERHVHEGPMYRMFSSGIYVGDANEFACYPYPSREDLESRHYSWWRSAQFRLQV